jgi:hypothetical protein
MSVMGIASSSIFSFLNSGVTQSSQSSQQTFEQEFQQLGQDLSSGNLSAAQAEFQSMLPQGTTTSGAQSSTNPLTTAMNQLATDLQSGNLSAAQQDYTTVKQDMSQQMQGTGGHHHHQRHWHAGSAQDSSQNPIDQLFSQLGQALQSGNLSAAQSAYSSLQQDFAAMSGTSSTASPVSVSA